MMEDGTVFIYYARFHTPLPAARFAQLLAPLPSAMQKKVSAFRRWEDAHASLFGKLLLQRACHDQGLACDLHHIQYSAFGRPYLENGIDFNISHSGTLVVCAVSARGKIGIDIELNAPLNHEDFRSQFGAQEWESIVSAPSPLPVFYKYWTMKEAILKADGSGLNASLAALNVIDPARIFYDGGQWHIKAINGFENYICHVASQEAGQRYELREIRFMGI